VKSGLLSLPTGEANGSNALSQIDDITGLCTSMTSEAAIEDSPEISGVIINACYPRSGNAFLWKILFNYFGSKLIFYEPYEKQVVRRSSSVADINRVNFVKTHDFDLEGRNVLLDTFPDHRRYLVQIRHPLESIASYWEFSLRHGHILTDDMKSWKAFLTKKLRYWKLFCSVWQNESRGDSLTISYDDLYSDRLKTAEKVVGFMTLENSVDEEKLNKAIENSAFLQYEEDQKSKKSERRNLAEFKYFDLDEFQKIEKKLVKTYLVPFGIKHLFQ
jgi:hypothetical protein